MADFHQNGNIATLHNLRTRSQAEMTYELETFAQTRKMTLILPCLYSELQTEAMIWNDSPRMQALEAQLQDMGLAPAEKGKGKNVWSSLGYLIACQDSAVMAIHDCDIVTYTNDLLARLIYPVANANFPYQVAKGYYARVGSDKLNGRVTRLLVSPLLIALKKVVGDRDYIDYLRAFRYPLSGEFAMRTNILPDLRIPSDWGLEIGVLSEAWRNLAPKSVCQVEIADDYDHKHQDLSEADADAGLNRMSTDICKAIFRKLAADGIDRHQEERAIELFTENIMRAGHFFLDNPHETPFIPTWNRVHSAAPDFLTKLREAAAADDAEYT